MLIGSTWWWKLAKWEKIYILMEKSERTNERKNEQTNEWKSEGTNGAKIHEWNIEYDSRNWRNPVFAARTGINQKISPVIVMISPWYSENEINFKLVSVAIFLHGANPVKTLFHSVTYENLPSNLQGIFITVIFITIARKIQNTQFTFSRWYL